MIRLFYSLGSCSLASHIALEEAGADYEAIRMDVRKWDQRKPEYLAINPKGRVPALATDRGVLTENTAILAWVAQAHPQAGLMPSDPWDFAQAQAFNGYLASTVHVAHAHRLAGHQLEAEGAGLDAFHSPALEAGAVRRGLARRHSRRGVVEFLARQPAVAIGVEPVEGGRVPVPLIARDETVAVDVDVAELVARVPFGADGFRARQHAVTVGVERIEDRGAAVPLPLEGAWRADYRAGRAYRLQAPLHKIALPDLPPQDWIAATGIGRPQGFFDMLTAHGIRFSPRVFADHHAFQAGDLPADAAVLMTEKDAVKCRTIAGANWWAVELDVAPEAGFMDWLDARLKR